MCACARARACVCTRALTPHPLCAPQNLWMPPVELTCASEADCPALASCFDSGSCPASTATRYLYSTFWAMTATTGVGRDVMPVSVAEHCVTIVITAAGLFLVAGLIGAAATAVANLESTSADRRRKLESLHTYMRQRGLPDQLRVRVRQFYQYMWASHQSLAHASEPGGVLEDLHPILRRQLHVVTNLKLLQSVPLFCMIKDRDCLVSIVDRLQPRIYVPDETVRTPCGARVSRAVALAPATNVSHIGALTASLSPTPRAGGG